MNFFDTIDGNGNPKKSIQKEEVNRVNFFDTIDENGVKKSEFDETSTGLKPGPISGGFFGAAPRPAPQLEYKHTTMGTASDEAKKGSLNVAADVLMSGEAARASVGADPQEKVRALAERLRDRAGRIEEMNPMPKFSDAPASFVARQAVQMLPGTLASLGTLGGASVPMGVGAVAGAIEDQTGAPMTQRQGLAALLGGTGVGLIENLGGPQKLMVHGAIDDVFTKAAERGILKTMVKSGLEEGAEEIPQQFIQDAAVSATTAKPFSLYDTAMTAGQNAMTAFGPGAIMGGGVKAGANVRDGIQAKKESEFYDVGFKQASKAKPNPDGVGGTDVPVAPETEIQAMGDPVARRFPPVPEKDRIAKAVQSVDTVLRNKTSVPASVVRDDIGEITLDYGKEGDAARDFKGGWGLSKIVAKRNKEFSEGASSVDGEAFARIILPAALVKGKLTDFRGESTGRRAHVEWNGNRIALSLFREGQRETWVVTGFEKFTGTVGKQGVNPTSTYATPPSGIQEMPGAATDTLNMAQPSPNVNTEDGDIQFMAGVNYRGKIADKFDPPTGASFTGDPKRREPILSDLAKAFGVPLYFGKVRGKKVKGFFRPSNEEVRIKDHGDLEVTAHEIAHLLDKKVPAFSQAWSLSPEINKELRGVSYDRKQVKEGFAEFVRLWMTQPRHAESAAPTFHTLFERTIDQLPQGKAIRKAKEEMIAWFEQGAADRLLSKIGASGDVRANNPNAHLAPGLMDDITQKVFDDLYPIKRMEKELVGGIEEMEGGAYETARTIRNAKKIVEGAMKWGPPVLNLSGKVSFDTNIGGLESIMRRAARTKENEQKLKAYFVARAARELMAQGREKLFTPSEIEAGLSFGDSNPKFVKAFDEYQAWNRALVNFAIDREILSSDQVAKWQRQDYVPFYRQMDDRARASFRGDVAGKVSGPKRLMGSTRNIADVFDNMTRNANMLITAAVQNDARLQIVEIAKRAGGARFMAKIDPSQKIVSVQSEQVRNILSRFLNREVDEQTSDEIMQRMEEEMPEFMKLFQGFQSPKGDVVAVMRDGKAEYYEVADKPLFEALQAFNRPAQTWIIRLASYPKQWLHFTATRTPGFALANPVRDTLATRIMSRHGYRLGTDFVRGFIHAIREDEVYRDYIANGGGIGGIYGDGKLSANLQNFYNSRGVSLTSVITNTKRLFHAMDKVLEATEEASRVMVFQRAMEAGKDARHAAYLGRNTGTDFAMRGSSRTMGAFYDTVPFLKAGMEGMYRMSSAIVEDPNRRTIQGRIAVLCAISAALAVWNAFGPASPLWDDLEDWDKDTNWHFFVPTPKTMRALADGDEFDPYDGAFYHFRLPKIWEIGAIATVTERMTEGTIKGEKGEQALLSIHAILSLFKLGVTPQVVKPGFEIAANRDSFTGRPIETLGDDRLAPYARSDEYTSGFAKGAAMMGRNLPRAIQFSPKQVDHIVQGYFGKWGTTALAVADRIGGQDITRVAKRPDELPGIARFLRTDHRTSKFVSELYELIDVAKEAEATAKAMAERGNMGIAGEEAMKADNIQIAKAAEKYLKAFRDTMTDIRESKNIFEIRDMAYELKPNAVTRGLREYDGMAMVDDMPRLKRILLDEMTERRNRLARKIMRATKEKGQKQ